MSAKPVIARASDRRDVEDAVDHYSGVAGDAVVRGFIDSLEVAYLHIAEHPQAGSTRYAHDLDLAGLRSWRLKRYPHIVFYVEREEHIDVWRVLHGRRDIPSWMLDPESEADAEP